jgi:metal-responsive CopG/Arc/MetJ family transcriptional regulator
MNIQFTIPQELVNEVSEIAKEKYIETGSNTITSLVRYLLYQEIKKRRMNNNNGKNNS